MHKTITTYSNWKLEKLEGSSKEELLLDVSIDTEKKGKTIVLT